MRPILIAAALLALTACNKTEPKTEPKQPAKQQPAPAAEAGPVKGLDRSHKGKPVPDVAFDDPDGGETSLAEFAGKPLLVNLWATWCAPCVKELPTLDRLSWGATGPRVVAISQDMGPHASVEAFLNSHKIANLDAYQDPKMALSGALGAEVLPTSILYDAHGKEVWRYVGDLDWTSDEAAKLLAEGGVTQGR
jgi:thiol-disulfide isomerase/thioredoxin